LWTPTTAVRNRPDPWVVEVIAGVNLRDAYALADGDVVEILLLEPPSQLREDNEHCPR